MINLEVPRKFGPLVAQARQVADEVFRPISRKYDREEHARPVELDMLAALIDGMNDGSDYGGAGATGRVDCRDLAAGYAGTAAENFLFRLGHAARLPVR